MINRRHWVAVLIGLALWSSLAQSADPPPKSPSDQEIRAKIVGTWIVDTQVPNGISIKGYVTLASDHTFVSKGTLKAGDKEQEIEYEGKWEIKEGVLIETITKSNNKGPTVGTVTRDKVTRITEDELEYETEKGKAVTRKRRR